MKRRSDYRVFWNSEGQQRREGGELLSCATAEEGAQKSCEQTQGPEQAWCVMMLSAASNAFPSLPPHPRGPIYKAEAETSVETLKPRLLILLGTLRKENAPMP